MDYQWKTGSRISGLAAETVARHLESLERERGCVSPEAVVESARPSTSVIHKAFEWSNKVAADQYRLEQARLLLRSLEIRIENPLSEEPLSVRAYLNAEPEDDGDCVYFSLETIRNDDALKAQVLSQVRRDISAARSKLNALESVFAELLPLANLLESAQELAGALA